MPSMNVGYGFMTRRCRDYYAERARGGTGAIIVGDIPVDAFASNEVWGHPWGVVSFVDNLRLLAEGLKKAGAKIGVQLWHGNRFPVGTWPGDTQGELVAPSGNAEMRALTIEEIRLIIDKFGQASARVREAGFDFVEFHAAHACLACQFFSPHGNHRKDEYGGDLGGRMRFGLDCVKAVRQAVGDDYPVFCRFAAKEDIPDGINIEDSILYAREMEKAGVDVLSVSIGLIGPPPYPSLSPTYEAPIGTFIHLAEIIKKNVQVPVIAVGRIHTSELAESVLAEGKADLVAVGRQLIADPYWPKKVAGGQTDDIRPCLCCNRCSELVRKHDPINYPVRCAVNAAMGREEECRLKPASKCKRVVVIGGGPGGMEAARVAAERGHKVTLFEKEKSLGGQLRLAALGEYKSDVGRFINYLIKQMDKTGVEVRLNEEVDARATEKMKPDTVIVATGSTPLIPDIPGVNGRNVVTVADVLTGHKDISGTVIIIGGGLVGCETAEFLLQKNKRVIILEMLKDIGTDIEERIRERLLYRLEKAGARIVTEAEAVEITDEGVKVNQKGSPQFFEGNAVVLAVGVAPNQELARVLKGVGFEVYAAGDCTSPRKIFDAIHDGARIGHAI